MHRFFADSDRAIGELSYLESEDAHHAFTVLRMKPGQSIEVISGGMLWKAEIISADTSDVCIRMLSPLSSPEAALEVTLFQGLPKSDKMDLIVQKATELGVSRIIPVIMKRCVSRPDTKDMPRRLQRWIKIAREASKQSGRCIIPDICEPVTLQHIPLLPSLPEVGVVPWEEAEGFGPLSFRQEHPSLSSLGILIGPEGGIESDEISILRTAGFIPLTLGKRILRTETAGLAAISALMSLYGEME